MRLSLKTKLLLALGFLVPFAGLVALGLYFENAWQFQSGEALNLAGKARAALLADSERLMGSILVPPPLAYYGTLFATALRLPQPAVWVSAFCGSLFLLWTGSRLLRNTPPEFPARGLFVGLLLLALLAQPGFLQSGAFGTATAAYLGLLALGQYFLARFILDMEIYHREAARGRMSAWISADAYQHDRLKFLWGAALAFGSAGFAREGGLLVLVILLPATYFFMPKGSERTVARFTALALLIYLPLAMSQFTWGYLGYIFGGETFRDPRHLNLPDLVFSRIFELRHHPLRIAAYLLEGIAWSCPVALWLLFRFRNVALVLIFGAPLLTEAVALFLADSRLPRDLFASCAMLSVLLLALGVGYGRVGRKEAWALALLVVASVCPAWHWFLDSPLPEERVWTMLDGGKFKKNPYAVALPEREMLGHLKKLRPEDRVLLDNRQGNLYLALWSEYRVAAAPLIPTQRDFDDALANPDRAVRAVLYQAVTLDPDRVSQHWQNLSPEHQTPFVESRRVDAWILRQKLAPKEEIFKKAPAPDDGRSSALKTLPLSP